MAKPLGKSQKWQLLLLFLSVKRVIRRPEEANDIRPDRPRANNNQKKVDPDWMELDGKKCQQKSNCIVKCLELAAMKLTSV